MHKVRIHAITAVDLPGAEYGPGAGVPYGVG